MSTDTPLPAAGLVGATAAHTGAIDQRVAAGGVAYAHTGVHIGDVTITTVAAGYRVQAWPATRPAGAAPSTRQPSRLLAAANQVVPFTLRGADLATLTAWRDDLDSPVAARLLHAPGGQGKTRLAARFAELSATAGWAVAIARHRSERGAPGQQAPQVRGVRGLLLVVDYAERWPANDLLDLLSDPLLRQGVPTRVLLLSRPAGWWQTLAAPLHRLDVSAASVALPPLAADATTRRAVFTEAAARFAATDLYHLTGPIPDPPAALDHDDAYRQVLVVHMAALAAVDATARTATAPTSSAGLSAYLFDREHEHWRVLHTEKRPDGYATTPTVMARTVYTAILTQALPHQAGIAALARAGIAATPETAGQILADHATVYPPADPATVLEPLSSDRLGEDFLALSTPGHDTPGHTSDPWAADAAIRLLTPTADGEIPDYAAAAVTVLVETARRWPHIADRLLYPLLCGRPQLAVGAGSVTLTRLATLPDMDPTVLEAIEPLLPENRHVDLDAGAAAITHTLTTHRLNHTTDPATRARLHATLSWRLYNAGRHDEALASSEAAVDLDRRLAETNPADHLPHLAASLNNLSILLSELGRHDEALPPSQEAVAIRRRLAEANPDIYLPVLAASLNNLGIWLSKLGHRDEALTPSEEAVDLERQLAETNPAAHLPNLTRSLTSLSILLSELGRHDEALPPTQEAVAIRRRLVKAHPDVYLPDLAASLTNLGTLLSELSRHDEALAPSEEAVDLYRRLAEANPAAYLSGLARSLTNLGTLLSELGRQEEPLSLSREAVDLYRRPAQTNPGAHLPNLATSLLAFARVRVRIRLELPEALAAVQEAISLYEPLVDRLPDTFGPQLQSAHHTLADVLDGLDRSAEAADLRRQLAKAAGDPPNRDSLP